MAYSTMLVIAPVRQTILRHAVNSVANVSPAIAVPAIAEIMITTSCRTNPLRPQARIGGRDELSNVRRIVEHHQVRQLRLERTETQGEVSMSIPERSKERVR
jgi:hypothetical protein